MRLPSPVDRSGRFASDWNEYGPKGWRWQPIFRWWRQPLEGLYLFFLGIPVDTPQPPAAPEFSACWALLVSGGHSELNLMTNHLNINGLARRLDGCRRRSFR
jgi:hypothetical protein